MKNSSKARLHSHFNAKKKHQTTKKSSSDFRTDELKSLTLES